MYPTIDDDLCAQMNFRVCAVYFQAILRHRYKLAQFVWIIASIALFRPTATASGNAEVYAGFVVAVVFIVIGAAAHC